MFFKKSTLALAFVALASIASAAQTPACILDVMGNTANPDDMKAICVTNTKQVQSQISNKCGATAQSALQFYANTCQEYGHKVELSSSNNSSGSTKTSDSNATTTTGSGFITAASTSGSQATGSSNSNSNSGSSSSGSSSGGSSASGSSTASSPAHTGAAVSDRQLSGTAFAAAVFIGAAALL